MYDTAVAVWYTFTSIVAQHPLLASMLALSIQLLSITVVAALLVKSTKNAPAWSNRIWFSAIVLGIAAIPFHCSTFGWSVGVRPNPLALSTASKHEMPSSQSVIEHPTGDDAQQFVSNGTIPSAPQPVVAEFIDATTASDIQLALEGISTDGTAVNADQNNTRSLYRDLMLPLLLMSLYAVISTMILIRLVWGIRRLQVVTQTGSELPADAMSVFASCADKLQLSTLPQVTASAYASMPLTFGWFRNTVLLPLDFSTWSKDEQRAVAMHELAHVKRGDVRSEFVSRLMVAIYWFHPASLYLQRMLRVTRELATDELVLDSGEDRRAYAKSIVAILARMHTTDRYTVAHGPSVAMSQLSDVEQRLKKVLSGTRQPISIGIGSLLIAILVVVAVSSTFQLKTVDAQSETTSEPVQSVNPDSSVIQVVQQSAGPSNSSTWDAVAASENDLLSRIRDCDVVTVTGDEYSATMTVEGQVVSATGQPVEDAIVLLRESSTARISSEFKKYIEIENQHLLRVNDVFARTRTDRDGKYRFENVKSPALPKRWSNGWEAGIVAGHPQEGIGWQALAPKQDRQRIDSGLTVTLSRTNDISGTFSTPSSDPIAGAFIQLLRIEKVVPSNFEDRLADLDLQASQLAPRSTTGPAGVCTIKNLPRGFAALVYAPNQLGWMSASAAVATSGDIALGDRGRRVLTYVPNTLVLHFRQRSETNASMSKNCS